MLYDVVLLRTYIAVCDSGSFTKAAKEVHLTQSAVSLQVKRLEEQVGLPLILRNSHRLGLTEEGEILLQYARRILSLFREASSRLKRNIDAVIRIAVPEYFHLGELNYILRSFKLQVPSARIKIELGHALDGESVDMSEFDIVITTAEIHERSNAILCREMRGWAGGRDIQISPKTPIPLALSPPPDSWRSVILDCLEEIERPWYVVLQSHSVCNISLALRAGLAVSALPAYMINDSFVILGEKEGLPPLPEFEFVLSLSANASDNSQLLANLIKKYFQEMYLKNTSDNNARLPGVVDSDIDMRGLFNV